MRRWSRSVLVRLLRLFNLESAYALWERGALREAGWFRSFRTRTPVDADGQPLPWLTYPAISFLEGRVRSEMRVFEYGCGFGTLWWAARVREVVSCEHDSAWREVIAARVPAHVTIHHIPLVPDGAYSRAAASSPNHYDIVVIDGRDRVHCARHAVDALKPDGVIVWDNTDRARYEPGIRALEESGFRRIDFDGMAPVESIQSRTSVFYRVPNSLGI